MKKVKKQRRRGALLLTGIALSSGILPLSAHAAQEMPSAAEKVYTTSAEGVVNLGKGDAQILIRGNENQSLKGKKFEVHQIFAEENSVGGESVTYSFIPKYEEAVKNVTANKMGKTPDEMTEYMVMDYLQGLNNVPKGGEVTVSQTESRYSEFRYFIEELRNEISKLKIKGDLVVVDGVKADNSVDITGLPCGYYVVDEVSDVGGKHSAASLCMVNSANPFSEMNIKSDYPDIVKKIREDDNRAKIGNEGWNDIGDYEIGQIVPYKFTSNIPNISGYATYYYAWHDRMDEALTFKPDQVSVEIKDTKSGKTYTLKPEEFKITENPIPEETFKIEVQDIKSIIDTQFYGGAGQMDQEYGQQVVVNYQAVLNDKAAKRTGRPGFENDVQLEFSNNPDSNGVGSTGKTPWDTVVCFTYKLNGLKQNENNTSLAGAEFALYYDKECTKEVFVKQTVDGYVVMNRDTTGEVKPKEAVRIVSDASGKFTVAGLDGGIYYLKEEKAPAGYRKIKTPIKIEVIPTFTEERNSYIKGDGALDTTLVSLEYIAHVKQFLNGLFKEDTLSLQTDAAQGAGNLVVVNYKGNRLPITGSSLSLLLLVLSVVLGISAFTVKKTKTGSDEE